MRYIYTIIYNCIQHDMYCDLVHCQYNVGQGCEITQDKVATMAVLVVTSLVFFGQHYFISIWFFLRGYCMNYET